MKIAEAQPLIQKVIGKTFRELYTKLELANIIIAKGKTGQLLEKIIELEVVSFINDFEDGELKTNKANRFGLPVETMFISQILSHIDELFNKKLFENTWLYQKIKRLIYLPVVKESIDPNEWYFLAQYFVEIGKESELYNQLEEDYYTICDKMIDDVENKDGFIHTSSGKYIQIRTKDSQPYSPIYSQKYSKYISNKNFAFYFKKEFMIDVQKKYGIKYHI